MSASPEHCALVKRAAQWLRSTANCRLVLTEMRCAYVIEQPDAIGWKYLDSYVVECKVSRSDFFADRKKTAALAGKRVGAHRFYMTPAGMLRPEEIPEPWGLLEVHGNRVRQIVRPLAYDRVRVPEEERDLLGEMGFLLAAAQGVSATVRRQILENGVAA